MPQPQQQQQQQPPPLHTSSLPHTPSCCPRMVRWLLLAPLVASLLLVLISTHAATSHSYTHPLALWQRLTGGRGSAGPDASVTSDLTALTSHEYPSPQTCAMSYFALSHAHIPVTRVSEVSRRLLEGQLGVTFGGAEGTDTAEPLTPSHASSAAPLRRRSAEFDEDDDDDGALLAAALAAEEREAAAEAEAAAAAAAPKLAAALAASLNASQKAQQAEFASFRQMFLHSLPTALSPHSSSGYKVWQYVATRGNNRNLHAYERELHPFSSESGSRSPSRREGRVPVVFLHGNGGSYHQMRSLATRLNALAQAERDAPTTDADTAAPPPLNDYYALDMLEESSALHGRLLWQQSWFANEALSFILDAYAPHTRAILVCHSMAGLVCRALFSLANFPRTTAGKGKGKGQGQGRVAHIITLGTPHRAPVLLADEDMKNFYYLLNSRNDTSSTKQQHFGHLAALIPPGASLHSEYARYDAQWGVRDDAHNDSNQSPPPSPPMLISVSGGQRDFQVEAALTDLGGIYDNGNASSLYTLSVASHSLNFGLLGGGAKNRGGGVGGQKSGDPRQGLVGSDLTDSTVPGGRVDSIDHQCLAWCSQLVDVMAASVRSATRHEQNMLVAEEEENSKSSWRAQHLLRAREHYELQRRIWVPEAVLGLRGMIEDQPVQLSAPPAAAVAAEEAAVTGTDSTMEWVLDEQVVLQGRPLTLVSPAALDSSSSEALLFVWTGLMRSVQLCPSSASASASNSDAHSAATNQTSSECAELLGRVQRVGPLLHPSVQSRAQQNELGALGTFVLHVPRATLLSLAVDRSTPLELRMRPHALFVRGVKDLGIDVESKSESKRAAAGAERIVLGVGMAYRTMPLDLSAGGGLMADLPNRAGVYRWSRSLPPGIELHLSLQVQVPRYTTTNDKHRLLRDSLAPPPLIALFTSSSTAEGDESDVTAEEAAAVHLSPSSFADQLFVFPPAARADGGDARAQPRPVHFYRSGVRRTALGMLIRLPLIQPHSATASSTSSASSAAPPVRVALVSHALVSFLRGVYLSLPLLPQMLLGVALLLFGGQHETLRRSGGFPRMYQLVTASSTLPSVLGVIGALCAGFVFLWRGALVGEHLLSLPSAGDGAEHAPPLVPSMSALYAGWAWSSWDAGTVQRACTGLALAGACAATILLLEALVYAILWTGRQVVRAVGWVVTRPFRSPVQAGLNDPAVAASPQRRYVASLARKCSTALLVLSYIVAVLFSLSLAWVSLDRFGGFGFGGGLHFLLRELTAWVSTALMMFRVIGEHVYFDRDVLPIVSRVVVVVSGVHLAPLVLVCTLGAVGLHAATFPDAPRSPASSSSSSSPSSPPRPLDAASWSKYRSSAAYKVSCVTLLLLVSALFTLPTFLGSFRLDGTALVRAAQAEGGRGQLLFTVPGAPRIYDAGIAAPHAFPVPGSALPDAVPSVFLFPLSLHPLLPLLPLLSLCWLTLLSWCALHVPFSPPVLQAACMSAYGLCLLLVTGVAAGTSFAHLPWLMAMLCLCMLPHALASCLFALHLLWDRVEGSADGTYERRMQQERQHWQTQASGPNGAAPASSSASKKTR